MSTVYQFKMNLSSIVTSQHWARVITHITGAVITAGHLPGHLPPACPLSTCTGR